MAKKYSDFEKPSYKDGYDDELDEYPLQEREEEKHEEYVIQSTRESPATKETACPTLSGERMYYESNTFEKYYESDPLENYYYTKMVHVSDSYAAEPLTEEIGSNLCRVRRSPCYREYGGYRMDILTENLNERDKVGFICTVCSGIMKEACISSSGEQFCSCCRNIYSYSKEIPSVPVRKMINTLKCSCPLIERGCKWLGTLKDCEEHLDTCGYVYVSCKLTCGVVLRRNELEKHEKETCPQRVVKCEHCKKAYKYYRLNEHLNKCPKMKVPCDLCDTQITREDMPEHLKHDCGMVQETCQLGCGMKLTRNELKIHEKDTCVQRKIACEHCDICLKFCDYSKHLRECPYMKVSCDLCSIGMMYRKDMTKHLKDYCPEKMIECLFVKYKCTTVIKRKDMDNHLEEKETKHMGLKLTAMEDLISKQSEEMTEQREEISKQREENTKQREEITKQSEEISKQSEEITKQSEEITKQSEEITKQSEEITKQSEEITKQSEEITKQSEEISKQSEEITKQSVEFENKHCRASKEFEKEKRSIKLLYSITNVTSLVWNIGNVTHPMKADRYSVSKQYHEAGYCFSFKLSSGGELSIVFPETTIKYDNPFIAKCHIALSSGGIINCGKIEVKQKDLTRGCERVIARIPFTDICSNLTLEIYLTMQ